MASISDLRRQVDALDRHLVELIARRTTLIKQITTHLDGDEPDKEREQQVLSNWLEEGFDYDLDEASVEKISRAVMDLGRKAKDA